MTITAAGLSNLSKTDMDKREADMRVYEAKLGRKLDNIEIHAFRQGWYAGKKNI